MDGAAFVGELKNGPSMIRKIMYFAAYGQNMSGLYFRAL